jgi:hypothetical protein
MEIENEWFDVPKFEGLYQINKQGLVRSLDRIIKGRAKSGSCIRKGRILMGRISNPAGYWEFGLRKGGEKYFINAHRVLAILFIPNPENKPQVNHINGIKTDNRLSNLEWATGRENTIHAYRIGLTKAAHGEKHYRAKLNREAVLDIRSSALSIDELAIKYHVGSCAIAKVIKRVTWKHI